MMVGVIPMVGIMQTDIKNKKTLHVMLKAIHYSSHLEFNISLKKLYANYENECTLYRLGVFIN